MMYPKIGIRPVIDGRWGGIREGLEEQTMGMAASAKALMETLRYPDGTPSTSEVPDAITPYLPEHDVLLLQNHGALTVGCDLITAYYRMETLELYAKISLNAYLLGGAQEIPRDKIDRLLEFRENYYHITGRHPGYKKYSTESAKGEK